MVCKPSIPNKNGNILNDGPERNNKMIDKKPIIDKLKDDPISNANMINFIQDYTITDVKYKGDSILVKGKSDENWLYISSSSKGEFTQLLETLTYEEQFFAIMEDWMLEILLKKRSLDWRLSCMKLYFPDDIVLPENKCVIDQLEVDEAQYIYDNYGYQEFTTVAYIKQRIKKGVALGIHKDNVLIAFVMTHDDGAIGFLHVIPAYRRKGYAQELTIAAINRLRESGHISYVHIEEDNEKSMNLAKKAGFIPDRRIHWVKAKEL